MGWNDMLRDGLAPDVAIMPWTGVEAGVDPEAESPHGRPKSA